MAVEAPIGILYEHPLWFEPLFAELDRRQIDYAKLHAGALEFDPGERKSPYSLVVNRMSPSAWTRGHAHAIFHSLHFLAYLDTIGAEVVNGHQYLPGRDLQGPAVRALRGPRTPVPEHPCR
jgi:hypothetical protein